ncbi:putative major facilitator superfamily transporter [Gordonia effusa NBRC 100432]|uniref:Putative major facilitator superfamily transporter n=1 Tax=Gordonia effusa NBRC 100432 TaxID=1077974 RepID=H0QXA4_9ACTN|nr:putative major facilitator superfamily transporter [Gordonia effusa NBRC 100432]
MVISLFVGAAVLAVAWVVIELKVRSPLVDLSLFRLRTYDGALTANLTMNLAYAGLSYVLVLWLQSARGYSAVTAGILMLPAVIGIFGFIPLGGRMDSRLGGRTPVLIGLVVLAFGMAMLGALHGDSTMWLISGALVVIGAGLGLLSTPVSNTAVGDVPGRLSGAAAGVFKMSSMVGGALGVALVSAIARALTISDSQRAVADSGLTPGETDRARAALVNSTSFADALGRLPAELQKKVTDAVVIAFTHGIAVTTIVTAVFIALATVAVWFLWPSKRESSSTTT